MTRGGMNPVVRRLVRDLAIALALLLTGQLWQQAERSGPQYTMAEIAVVEGVIAGFACIDNPETAPMPQGAFSVLRPRTAFWLADHPPNLLFFQEGNSWRMENDVPIRSPVCLDVRADIMADAARSRQHPEVTYPQPLDGLQVNGVAIAAASDTLARADGAARLFRRTALAAGVAALG